MHTSWLTSCQTIFESEKEKEDQKSLFLLNLLCINHDIQELFLSDDL